MIKESERLDVIQKYLTAELIKDLEEYDFDAVEKRLAEIKRVDRKRREAWHKEKFGPYEQLADNILAMTAEEREQTFSSDDIPF